MSARQVLFAAGALSIAAASYSVEESFSDYFSLLQVGHAVSLQQARRQVQRGGNEGNATADGAVYPRLPPATAQDCDYLRDSTNKTPCSPTTTTTTTTTTVGSTAAGPDEGVAPSVPPPAQQDPDYVRDDTTGTASTEGVQPPLVNSWEKDITTDGQGVKRLVPMAVVDDTVRQVLEAKADLLRARRQAIRALRRSAQLREDLEAHSEAAAVATAKAASAKRRAAAVTKETKLLDGTLTSTGSMRQTLQEAMSRLDSSRSQTLTIAYQEVVPCPPPAPQGSVTSAPMAPPAASGGYPGGGQDSPPATGPAQQPPVTGAVAPGPSSAPAVAPTAAKEALAWAAVAGAAAWAALAPAPCQQHTVNRSINVSWHEVPQLQEHLALQGKVLRALEAEIGILQNTTEKAVVALGVDYRGAVDDKEELEDSAEEHLEEKAVLAKAYKESQAAFKAADPWQVGADGFSVLNASLLKFHKSPAWVPTTTSEPPRSASVTIPVWALALICAAFACVLGCLARAWFA